MSTYYTILTNLGAALHANAQVTQTTVPWTHMCLGDGGGVPVVPVQTQTALKREVHRLAITDIAQHPDNPNWLIVEAVVPSDVGGWTVRETAIYGGANGTQCIAVGNYPETYKPVLAEGAAREMVMRMVVEISSTATVKLTIDPAVAIASRAWVESLVATPQKRGLVKLATVDESKEGVRPDVAVTPEGLGAALETRQKALGDGQTRSAGAGYLENITYPNPVQRTCEVRVMGTTNAANGGAQIHVNGIAKAIASSPLTVGFVSASVILLKGETFKVVRSSMGEFQIEVIA